MESATGTELDVRRTRMTQLDLAGHGIDDERVLGAFRRVPRERFVPAALEPYAYDNRPLPIGEGQTISQPLMVAIMLEALELHATDRVLEIGTGTGYAAALAAELATAVTTIERLPALASQAAGRLRELGYRNIVVGSGDGTLGWLERAPFDAILVSAGGPHLPGPLLDQLAEGGRLVMPVGRNERSQRLVRVRCHPGPSGPAGRHFTHEDLGGVRFVPLIGVGGWPESARVG